MIWLLSLFSSPVKQERDKEEGSESPVLIQSWKDQSHYPPSFTFLKSFLRPRVRLSGGLSSLALSLSL